MSSPEECMQLFTSPSKNLHIHIISIPFFLLLKLKLEDTVQICVYAKAFDLGTVNIAKSISRNDKGSLHVSHCCDAELRVRYVTASLTDKWTSVLCWEDPDVFVAAAPLEKPERCGLKKGRLYRLLPACSHLLSRFSLPVHSWKVWFPQSRPWSRSIW